MKIICGGSLKKKKKAWGPDPTKGLKMSGSSPSDGTQAQGLSKAARGNSNAYLSHTAGSHSLRLVSSSITVGLLM